MATWACALRRPSDIGYSDDGYDLPGLDIVPEVIDVTVDSPGQLFATELGGVGGRARVRRSTLGARTERAVELCSGPGQWIVWCGLNDEAAAIAKAVDGAMNVDGAMSPTAKADAMERFQDNQIRVLVSKTSICGFGMNFQNCHQQIFVGISDSHEQYYQAIRRSYRYGQRSRVAVHIIVSALEQQIVENVARKEAEHLRLFSHLITFNPIRKTTSDATITNTSRTPRRMLASTNVR